MRTICTLAFIILAVSGFGQVTDSTRIGNKVNKWKDKVSSIPDTLNRVELQKKDSILNKVDSVKDAVQQRIDSTKNSSQQKIDSVKNATQQRIDSVSRKFSQVNLNKIDQALSGKGDSVAAYIATNQLRGIDSLQQKIDEVSGKASSWVQSKVMNKKDSLLTDLTDSFKLDDQINQDILDKTNIQLPVTDTPSIPIPDDVNLPPLIEKSDLLKHNVPNVSIPLFDAEIKNKVGLENIPDLNTDIEILNDSGKLNIDVLKKMPGNERIEVLTDNLEGIEQVKSEISKIKDPNIQDVDTKMLETKVAELAGVDKLETEAQQLKALQAQHEAMLQRYKDKKLLQDEITRKSSNVKNSVINKSSEVLKQVHEQTSKARKLNSAVQSVKDMPKRRTNEMKGKPFFYRLQPGVTIQSSNDTIFTIETGIQFGYRLTGRLTIGVAGIHRFGFSDEFKYFVSSDHTYGYRGFVSFTAFKGFYLQGEYERLRLYVVDVSFSEKKVDHTATIAVGLGKQFTISKNWAGSILGIYRIQSRDSIPKISRFGIRLGFTFTSQR